MFRAFFPFKNFSSCLHNLPINTIRYEYPIALNKIHHVPNSTISIQNINLLKNKKNNFRQLSTEAKKS